MPDPTDIHASRFIRAAQLCRTRDLERLFALGELVKSISELIHGLQRERGASSIVLGSHGANFQDQLDAQVVASRELERDVRARLEHIDEKLDGMSFGARFYTRGALAFRALDGLNTLREQIAELTIAPQDAVRSFSNIIGCLLAVGFEVADIAADPNISRALIALANFAQGKEYAGQERATAGAAFSCGRFEAADKQRLRQLIAAQDQAFRVFCEFAVAAQVSAFNTVMTAGDCAEVKRMRKIALGRETKTQAPEVIAAVWFKHTTARIDAMQVIEQQMTAELRRLCAVKLAEARESPAFGEHEPASAFTGAPVAMLIADPQGVGLYTLDEALPKPMHSILDVIHAQSRRLNDVNHQLESARAALVERKAIERAKGLLMVSRQLSESQAYELMRETAMSQNRRIYEVAEAIISMAQILQPSL